jgi:hypothetical protein
MPLYDLMYIVKPYVRRRELADILMRTGRYVFANGGVVTKVESFGCRDLAYDFKVHGERFDEARPRASSSRSLQRRDHSTLRVHPGLRETGASGSGELSMSAIRMRTGIVRCSRPILRSSCPRGLFSVPPSPRVPPPA